MQTVHYRRWAPPQSPLKIEFPPGLLREIRDEVEQDHERGTLFGSTAFGPAAQQSGDPGSGFEIRALTSRRFHEPPRVAGMELVGVYICRTRGEVFLTDEDLAYMDQLQVRMALVIAGKRAGFFVHGLNGSIQAVRSYEEFLVADAAPQPERLSREPAQPSHARHPNLPAPNFLKTLLTIAAVLVVPAAGLAYLRPRMIRPPVEISLKSTGGQLVASWDPAETAGGGRLEITDAGERTMLIIPPGASSAVYQAHAPTQIGHDAFEHTVTIRLLAGERTGSVNWSSAKFAPPIQRFEETALPPSPLTPEAADARDTIKELELELKKLRWVEAGGKARLVELARQTEKLSSPAIRPYASRLTSAQSTNTDQSGQQ